MMNHFMFNSLAGIAMVSAVSAFALAHDNQYPLGSGDTLGAATPGHDMSRFRCDLPRRVDPSRDGLMSSEELFLGIDALETLVKRHQPLVRIPSICYDDLGGFDDDERWEPFYDIPVLMKETYPLV